jgi:hypothetical protein
MLKLLEVFFVVSPSMNKNIKRKNIRVLKYIQDDCISKKYLRFSILQSIFSIFRPFISILYTEAKKTEINSIDNSKM